MTRSPRVLIMGCALAALLVTAGVTLWVTAPGGDASFGWYSYEPIADAPNLSVLWFLHRHHVVAVALVVSGLITAAVVAGFCWVRRTRTQQAP